MKKGGNPERSVERGVETRRIRSQFLEWLRVHALVKKGCGSLLYALIFEYTRCCERIRASA